VPAEKQTGESAARQRAAFKEEKETVNSRSAVSGIEKARTDAELRIGTTAKAMIAAMVAITLGAGVIFVVGFSHSDLFHAAAHDVRHAAGFPCH